MIPTNQKRIYLIWSAIILFCSSGIAAEYESWTNRAGQVLNAIPQELSADTITFKKIGSEKIVQYPISIFPENEQERLRNQLENTEIPDGLKSAYTFSTRSIKRSRLLYENGHISKEAYDQNLNQILKTFEGQALLFVEEKKLSEKRLRHILHCMRKE